MLSEWVKNKFDFDYQAPPPGEGSMVDVAADIKERIREVYARREVTYPVDICLERAFAPGQPDSAYAAQTVVNWVNGKFRAGWTIDKVQGRPVEDVKKELVALNESFLRGDAFEREIQQALAAGNGQDLIDWGKKRFGRTWNPRLLEKHKGDPAEALRVMGRELFRWELGRMEHAVLLHIYDQAWKDHLLEMDHLKHAIMQRPLGGDQSHPQSQYAIEGREFFDQMWARIHERVTSMIFKVRMGGGAPGAGGPTEGDGDGAGPTAPRRPTAPINFSHADSTGTGFAGADRDQAAAMRAQGQQTAKVETIRREQPKVGRNDPCPCGSGKKYKSCHGKNA
jgi:preprotein translocase subunit SecA